MYCPEDGIQYNFTPPCLDGNRGWKLLVLITFPLPVVPVLVLVVLPVVSVSVAVAGVLYYLQQERGRVVGEL